jgi:hypothetical protein
MAPSHDQSRSSLLPPSAQPAFAQSPPTIGVGFRSSPLRELDVSMPLRSALFALLLLAGATAAGPASAQVQRTFPQTALRGALVIGEPPEITLNGKPARLAPGARIRDPGNMLAMSGTLAGNRLLVHYTLDPLGLVKDVWILTAEEAAKRPWPATSRQAEEWFFDPVAQTWSRP